jgi:ATP-binding cassette subfamily B protein
MISAEPTRAPSEPLGPLGVLRILLGYFRPYRALCCWVLVALLADLGADASLRFGFKFLIDRAVGPADEAGLVRVVGALVSVVVVYAVAALGRDYLYSKLGANVLNDIREHVFRHLQGLSMAFYRREQVADIMARFTSDLSYVETAVYYGIGAGVAALLGALFTLAPLFTLEWHLALFTLVCLPLSIIGPLLLGPRVSTTSYTLKERLAALASIVHENVSAQEVIQAFGLRSRALDAFRKEQVQVRQATLRFNVLWYFSDRIPGVTLLLVNVLILGVGSHLVFQRRMSVGALVSFHVFYLGLHACAQELMSVVVYLMQAVGGMRRIQEILDEAPTVPDRGRRELPSLKREIAFDDVSFGYRAGETQIEKLKLKIRKGTSVAFVGASGAGKSTALNLLLRFYDPNSGAVTIDGLDIRRVSHASLRAQIGVVFQDSFLFDTTIRENIRLGFPGASDAEVEAAAIAAEVDDFARKLPDGYETQVGERGSRLSGGQRQRIAIARAIVRNPSVLILDEATASLDAATAAAVRATLERLGHGRTVISVTHQLGTALNADRIFVFDGGRCVEQGRHSKLSRANGVYARLWEQQAGVRRDLDTVQPEPRIAAS